MGSRIETTVLRAIFGKEKREEKARPTRGWVNDVSHWIQ